MARQVLLVEDDREIAGLVELHLRDIHCVADIAGSGQEALERCAQRRYDLVILDLMLPDLDGLTICQRLRASGDYVPILMLTAKSSELDRVLGLELGADDYLVKPFAFAELLARVRSLVRRGHAGLEPAVLKVADLELDLLRRRAMRAGHKIELTAKEFALLELFLRRKGEVLPRSLIASQVWDMNFDSDTNVIDVAVRRLRAKIDEGF
jgi:two-component system copper resistance phosphate regulon response regulator CusR